MNIGKTEENIRRLTKDYSSESFIYELLGAYDFPNSNINLNAFHNRSIKENEILWAKQLCFREVGKESLEDTMSNLRESVMLAKPGPRLIIVANKQSLMAVDTITKDSLNASIEDLNKYLGFLP